MGKCSPSPLQFQGIAKLKRILIWLHELIRIRGHGHEVAFAKIIRPVPSGHFEELQCVADLIEGVLLMNVRMLSRCGTILLAVDVEVGSALGEEGRDALLQLLRRCYQRPASLRDRKSLLRKSPPRSQNSI